MAERGQGKNPAPKKKTNKTSTASSKGSKTSSKKTSATTNKATSKKQERDKTPFYILAIMILLCIIFIIINSFDFDKTSNKSNKIEKKVSNIPHKELNEFDSYTDNPVDDNDIHDRIKDEFADETYKKNNETNQLSEIDANIYFVKYNEENDAMSLVPVTRRIKSKTPLRQSLNELLDGPDDVDKTKGLLTAIPDNLLINNINIKNRRAEIDFNTA
ncbi:MAG: GerMN domain-containing protein, partial [Spirochaetota bacterium]|nr:GerMN domain-containing protein [Spirochaetota bacterium]